MNSQLLRDLLNERRASFEKLSLSTGVPISRLSMLADGADPNMKEMRLLGRVLRLDTRSLASPSVGSPSFSYDFLFRKTASTGRSVDQALVSKLSRKMDLSQELLPSTLSTEQPRWKNSFTRHEDYLDAEANARLFRRLFFNDDQLGPLTVLPQLVAGALGILLFLVDSPVMEGASVVTGGKSYIFLSRRFEPRMLFTLAHEVAHILFHHSDEAEYVTVDFESLGKNPELVSKSASRDERYAHAFASALLMPDAAVGKLLKRLRETSRNAGDLGDVEIMMLARFFGVSFLAAAVRCESLRLLPPGGAISLDEWVRKTYGSAEKRAIELGLPERVPLNFPYVPTSLLRAAIEKIKEGSLSIGRAASELGISVADMISVHEGLIH